jgi:very-short-patch-repair endonuclease
LSGRKCEVILGALVCEVGILVRIVLFIVMKPTQIIIGQPIDSKKLERAKYFRKNLTEAEKVLWQHLRKNQLNGLHFRRQQIIEGFIVDFYCHAAGLVIEVDGKIHEQQQEYDTERERILLQKGLNVLRVSNDEVIQEIHQVLDRILTACEK